MRVLYSLFMLLATPFVLAHFALRGLRDARYWRGWSERLVLGGSSGPCEILVQAASLGEVNAAAPLLRALLARPSAGPILITTFTPTGAARVRELFGGQLRHLLAPLDLHGATRRFLLGHRPSLLVIVETELWPNLLHQARRQNTPVLLVNARLSMRSVNGYRRLGALMRPAFAGLHQVLAQSGADAERFRQCGTPGARVEVAGNLKFETNLPDGAAGPGAALRQAWGTDRLVLVAGSTHEQDEEVLLSACASVFHTLPDVLLVLAPRHPERFERVAAGIAARGFSLARHSRGEVVGAHTQCLLVDAMGVLQQHYAAADLAFVGGTLAPVGGHNLLEPAALGKPVLFGPHLDAVSEIAERLLTAGAGRLVRDAGDLSKALLELLPDPARRARMGQAGTDLVAAGQGALQRSLAAIDEALSANPGSN